MTQPVRQFDPDMRRILTTLRSHVPTGPLDYAAALRLAERTASRLLELYEVRAAPIPAAVVGDLPKVRIEVDGNLPALTSGLSIWDARLASWVITLNGREPVTRQRFTTLHEFFHIMLHRHVTRSGLLAQLSSSQVEYVADYFAGCVLVPTPLLKQAWDSGMQSLDALSRYFDVSRQAIEVRVGQVGIKMATAAATTARMGAPR